VKVLDNAPPYLVIPPKGINMEIDMTNPVLSFEISVGEAFDD